MASLQDRFRSFDDLTWDVVTVLAAAAGPMSVGDVATVLDVPGRRVRAAVEPLRDAVGEGRLVLSGPALPEVRAELGVAEVQDGCRRLTEWCTTWAARRWPEETPGYVIEYGTRHIIDSDDLDAVAALLDPGLSARRGHPGDLAGVAAAARRIGESAPTDGPEGLVTAVRAMLIGDAAGELAGRVPPEVLGDLLPDPRYRALFGYPALTDDAADRSHGRRAVAAAHRAGGRHEEADAALDAALADARTIPLASQKASEVVEIVRAMVTSGRLANARAVACELAADAEDGGSERYPAVEALALVGEIDAAFDLAVDGGPGADSGIPLVLAQTGRVSQAVEAARRHEPDPGERRFVLGRVASELAKRGDAQAARAVADEAAGEFTRSAVLADIAEGLAHAGVVAAALDAARDAGEPEAVAIGLGRVARTLARGGRESDASAAAAEAIDTAARAAHRWERLRALTALVQTWRDTPLAAASVRAADNLRDAVADGSSQACAGLCATVPVLLRAGRSSDAAAAARQAHRIVRGLEPDTYGVLPLRAAVAEALALAGLWGDAAVLAGAVLATVEPSRSVNEVLAALVTVLVLTGDRHGVDACLKRVRWDHHRPGVQGPAAAELGRAGRSADAIAFARSTGFDEGTVAGHAVAGAIRAGRAGDARRLLDACDPTRQSAAVRSARRLLDLTSASDVTVLAQLVVGNAAVRRTVTWPAGLLAAGAGALGRRGEHLAAEAVALAVDVVEPDDLFRIGNALVEAGHPVMARDLAARALTSAVRAAAVIGSPAGRDVVDRPWQVGNAAGLLAATGDPGAAVTAVAAVTDPGRLVRALEGIGRSATEPRLRVMCDELWSSVEPLVARVRSTDPAAVARVLGWFGHAESVPDVLRDVEDRAAVADATADAALCLARRGADADAVRLADTAVAIAESSPTTVVTVARALAAVSGHDDRVRDLVERTLTSAVPDDDVPRQLAARALMDVGAVDRSLEVLGACRDHEVFGVGEVLGMLVGGGDRRRADALWDLVGRMDRDADLTDIEARWGLRTSRRSYVMGWARVLGRAGDRAAALALAGDAVSAAAHDRFLPETTTTEVIRLLPHVGAVDLVEPAVRAFLRDRRG